MIQARLQRAAICAFLLGGQMAAAQEVRVAVTGTAHQALFAVVTQASAAIAVGAAGEILQSRDGGQNWDTVQPAPTRLSLLGVTLQDGHAIAVGQMGTILLRDDDGTWRAVKSGTDNRLFAVGLNGSGKAVAVGAFGTILRSEDRGATWRAVAPDWSAYAKDGQEPHLFDARIDDRGVMTVVGEFGLILRSDDGRDWKTLHRGDASLFALDLRADGVGYAVGQNGAVLRTQDGGTSWADLASGTAAILLGVQSRAGGRVVVTGMHDTVQSDDDGRHWSHLQGSAFSSSWFQGIATASADASFLVVGNNGSVLRVAR